MEGEEDLGGGGMCLAVGLVVWPVRGAWCAPVCPYL